MGPRAGLNVVEPRFLGHPASSLMSISFVRECVRIIFSVFTLYSPFNMIGILQQCASVCVCVGGRGGACKRAVVAALKLEIGVGRRQQYSHLNRKIQDC
jgi:hypothetical protein